MFFITFSSLWSFSFFFVLTYITLILSVISYILPIVTSYTKYTLSKNKSNFSFINGFDLVFVYSTPYILLLLLLNIWVAPSISSWFGHIVFTSFQIKISYLIFINFIVSIILFSTTTYFSSREIYDYIIVTFSFCYWIIMLFA